MSQPPLLPNGAESASENLPAGAGPVPPFGSAPLDLPGSGLGAALALTGIYVGLLVGFQVVVTVGQMIRHRPEPGAASVALQMVVAFVITLALVPLLARRSWRDVLPRRPAPVSALPGSLLLILGGWIWALEIGIITEQFWPMPEVFAREFEKLFSQSGPVASLVLLTVVPPLVEEVLCRGMVLRAMLRRWRPGLAIGASSLVFGAMHLNPWQFFYAAWLGLLLGWVYWRTQSVGFCVLLHAVNNLLGWLVIRLHPSWAGLDRSSLQETPEHLPLLLLGAGIGLGLAGVALLLRIPRVTSDPDFAPIVPR